MWRFSWTWTKKQQIWFCCGGLAMGVPTLIMTSFTIDFPSKARKHFLAAGHIFVLVFGFIQIQIGYSSCCLQWRGSISQIFWESAPPYSSGKTSITYPLLFPSTALRPGVSFLYKFFCYSVFLQAKENLLCLSLSNSQVPLQTLIIPPVLSVLNVIDGGTSQVDIFWS